jgi:hypothetical protein
MRSQAQVLAQKFYYEVQCRRKFDRIRGAWVSDASYALIWRHRDKPIAILIRSPALGRFLQLDARGMKMTKGLAARFNAVLSYFGRYYYLAKVSAKWYLMDRDPNLADPKDYTPSPWKGILVLRLDGPENPSHVITIEERMKQLYGGKDWSSAA